MAVFASRYANIEALSIFMALTFSNATQVLKQAQTSASVKNTHQRVGSSISSAIVLACILKPIQRIQWWTREAANSLFSPSSDNSDDALMDIVRQDAVAASRFITIVMIISGFSSVYVCARSIFSLFFFWSPCQFCDRPLRWWLLMHTLLQVIQIPVRFVFLAKILHTDVIGDSIESCVSSFTASPAWYSSKKVSSFTYFWIILGIVWVVGVGDSAACPNIFMMTVAVIIQAVVRDIFALVCYSILFPQSDISGAELPKSEGADPDQISALPLVRFTSCLFSEERASCAVCLSEYELDESLRRLSCGHYFHRSCADQWLSQSKRCPLCIRPIDAVHGPSSFDCLQEQAACIENDQHTDG